MSVIESPLISVVVPVYNVRTYLPQCLESIKHQSYHNIDVIIIDDGSTDGSGLICDKYTKDDNRFQVLHTKNHGLATARNTGLKYVKGSYVLFVDSDDWIEPDTIEKLFQTATDTDAEIVVSPYSTEYIGRTLPSRKKEDNVRVFSKQDILPTFASGQFGDIVWNKLYHISSFRGIRFPDGHNYEDVSITWKIIKALVENDGSIAFLAKDLFHFRMRRTSISHTKSFSNVIDSWNAFYEKFKALKGYQDLLLPEPFMAIARMWLNYNTFSRDEKRKAKRIIREMRFFSKVHFHQIMTGNYSRLTKTICMITQFSNPFVFSLCFFAGRLRQRVRAMKYRMFD